jgi:glycosidase
LTNEGRGFPPDALILRFLNNNDTGERFASRHGVDMARLAATLLFTLPGLPLIYNGQEMAAEFEPYDEGPPLEWNDAHPLVNHYRKLAELRQRTDALRSRKLEVLTTTRDADVLAYLRPSETSDVLVLLNFSNRAVRVEGANAHSKTVLKRFSTSIDLLRGTRINAGKLSVGAKSALVLADQQNGN